MHGLFFDRKDREILSVVNRFLEAGGGEMSSSSLFNPNLHPHGIKELVTFPASRTAYAVINLLRNLELGGSRARERLLALQALYDEVLTSAHSALRRNTARVLMQIMKSMVRAHGDTTRQLMLAHDFRAAASGTPRVVRRLLARYHLPEMPEEWNQIAFDNHVYDVNTQGRKTPTHLIMDAWIKGLRTLTVFYDNCVEIDAADELIRAAEIMDITVRVGVEFQSPFYGRFVNLLWVPRGFSSGQDVIEFFQSPPLTALMERGRAVLHWRRDLALQMLRAWNEHQRPRLAERWCTPVAPAGEEELLDFLGRAHPSMRRIAEFLHRHVMPAMRIRARRLAELRDAGDVEAAAELDCLEHLTPNEILERWLSHEEHPEMPEDRPAENPEDMPEILRLGPGALARELDALPSDCRLTLCTTGLTAEDVTEILWDCEGLVTHLELFNLKGWMEGELSGMQEINEFQQALNGGLGPRIKQLVRQMIRRVEQSGDMARLKKFQEILLHIPMLWEVYRHKPLRSRIGANSSSARRSYGMGFVLTETLPHRALAALRQSHQTVRIPVSMPVVEHVTHSRPERPTLRQRFLGMFRFLPGCSHLGMESRRTWESASDNFQVRPQGNVVNLGGLSVENGNDLLDGRRGIKPTLHHLNSTASNCAKVLLGFIPAFCSFNHTQSWWVLAYLGAFIWFGITGFRNVVQMVLAARGANRGTLTHWKEHVNVNRLCDSLMYTGISVLLLELVMRVWVLNDCFGVTVRNEPHIVFVVLNLVNGFYIFSHNIYRGIPRQAAIGNIFRSILAIPVSALYNWILFQGLLACGVADPAYYLVPSATIISKSASDTVAAVIEGYADSQVNIRMRHWDYGTRIKFLFDCSTRLEMLFPRENALLQMARPGGLGERGGVEARMLERAFVIGALDLMYFWFYQPRAQEALAARIRSMPDVERTVLAHTQLILLRDRDVSQMMVDGILGRNFSRPLAFYLDRRREYLRAVLRLCRTRRRHEEA